MPACLFCPHCLKKKARVMQLRKVKAHISARCWVCGFEELYQSTEAPEWLVSLYERRPR